MLENLHIQNFRLFRNFKIENLARVNLIVGKNNVGKSSLLEAVNLLVRQYDSNELRETVLNMLKQRGETLERDRIYLLQHLFFGHKFETATPISLESNGFGLHIQAQPDQNQLVITPKISQEIQIKGVNADGYFKAGAEPVYPPAIKSINIQHITTGSSDKYRLRWLWDQIQLTLKEDDVVRLLQVMDSRVERIAFRATDPEALVKLENSAPLPLGNLGDGMSHLLSIAIALVTAADGYLLVDEIDTGLHYRTITDMWQVVMATAVRHNVQIFATTHSWDCIRSFAEALDTQTDDQNIGKLFRLERRGANIVAVEYTADDLAVVISQNVQNLEVR
ncbi:MAG: AAA family ATPase [Anaerolinea sp.]|nr:AAA family ATPase [Anaerolinea sp.]